jgi:hypothetical protein
MDKSLKFIYLSNLIEEYNKHYNYLYLELIKINEYESINHNINDISKNNLNTKINLDNILMLLNNTIK